MKYLSIIFFLFLMSCSSGKKEESGVLLRYNDRVLTLDEVEEMIPDGILPADSAALFKAIVDGWIQDNVLSSFAEERLDDLTAIERKVKDYRNSLIVQEYLGKMRESHKPEVDEVMVKEYYDRHRNDLKLETPLVKGIFLKINSKSKGKEEIKQLISSDDPAKIDKLEQDWMDRALEYNYFRDKWIDWESVVGIIPHRFGNPEKFLSDNRYFETEYGDCSYYLQVTDYLPAGEEQPYSYAKIWIEALLTQKDIKDYEQALVTSLIEQSIKEHKLEMVEYDVLKHEYNASKKDEK